MLHPDRRQARHIAVHVRTALVLTVPAPVLIHVPAPVPVPVPEAEERDAQRKTSTTRVLNLNSLNLKRNTGNKQGESAQKGRSLFHFFTLSDICLLAFGM